MGITFYVQTQTEVVWFYYLPISVVVCFLVALILGKILPSEAAPSGTTIWDRGQN